MKQEIQQTADERILPGGTAFITDLGMVGSLNAMLGMKKWCRKSD